MSTIPDTIKIISKNVQGVFEELVKLLLRKTINPVINPLGQKKIIYNANRCKYERGYIGTSYDDNINKFIYQMTNDSLGWTDEVFANFRMIAKTIKNDIIKKPPGLCTEKNKQNTKLVFTNDNKLLSQYSSFIKDISNRNINNIIANKNGLCKYTVSIPYSSSFKQLENIGKDILDQSDASVTLNETIKMSTFQLRIKLTELENNLSNLSVEYPDIFDSYLEMIRIINSTSKNKLTWIIKLLANLTHKTWEELDDRSHNSYINILGAEFIETIISNTLITILLQTNNTELILTGAYLYPLIKMLFVVFGYSKLRPIITDIGCDNTGKNTLNKLMQKYQDSLLRKNNPIHTRYNANITDINSSRDDYSDYSDNPYSEYLSDQSPSNSLRDRDNEFIHKKPDPEPVNQKIYEFIKNFGNFYPTLVGLMGGTEEFPPEQLEARCCDIPNCYLLLKSIPEFLWRFNDYSYCRYLEFLRSKKMQSVTNHKINEKIRYLTYM